MIKRFLKAKHWQLFILTFGIPILFEIMTIGSVTSDFGNGTNLNNKMILTILPIIMFISTGVFFGWFWSIAIGLQRKVPENVRMKVKKFKIFFFIPLIYILLISVFIGATMNGLIENGSEPNTGLIVSIFAIVVPIHLFSMFCIFYSLYFVAKTFKTVELQREVRFSDFAGEFFMIWFYPIGIWIIQPMINKMIEE